MKNKNKNKILGIIIFFALIGINISAEQPTVNLESPQDSAVDTDGNVIFTYNVTDADSIISCDLILDGTINQTNSTITKDVTQQFVVNGMTNGTYTWSVNCTDNSSNKGASETRTLNVSLNVSVADTTPPAVENSSAPNINLGDDAVIRVDAYDASGVDTVIVEVDGTANYIMGYTGSGNTYNATIPSPALGSHDIRYYANDTLGNLNDSVTDSFNVGDTTPPTVTLESPQDNAVDTDGDVVFNYNVTDEDSITSCDLIIDGTIKQTNSTITKGATQQFVVNGMTNGTYTWSVNCTDNSSNKGASETRTLNVSLNVSVADTTPPVKLVGNETIYVKYIVNIYINSSEINLINYSLWVVPRAVPVHGTKLVNVFLFPENSTKWTIKFRVDLKAKKVIKKFKKPSKGKLLGKSKQDKNSIKETLQIANNDSEIKKKLKHLNFTKIPHVKSSNKIKAYLIFVPMNAYEKVKPGLEKKYNISVVALNISIKDKKMLKFEIKEMLKEDRGKGKPDFVKNKTKGNTDTDTSENNAASKGKGNAGKSDNPGNSNNTNKGNSGGNAGKSDNPGNSNNTNKGKAKGRDK